MKVIICGPRDFNDYDEVKLAIEKSGFDITEVVSGTARGVDYLGEKWAKENGIPVARYKPKWNDIDHPEAVVKENRYGKYNAIAGFIRNEEMAMHADACIAIDTGSKGTADMISRAKDKELEIYCHPPYESHIADAMGDIPFDSV